MSAATALMRIATRQSRLALWQAEHVAAVCASTSALNVVLVPMTTQGDRITDRPLADIGGKGLFIKELELALAEGRADIAVHSMKDVPTDMPPGMTIVAMLKRADAHDAFVSLPRLSIRCRRAHASAHRASGVSASSKRRDRI